MKIKYLIVKEFGIPLHILLTYLKNKENILSKLAPNVDECVYKWFKQIRDKTIPPSGISIRVKTEKFSLKLQNIISKQKLVNGESGDVNVQEYDDWKIKFLQMVKRKKTKDILIRTKQTYFTDVFQTKHQL